MKTAQRHILLVEDDENDIFFMRRAMAKAFLPPPVHVCTDGQDALDYLMGTGKYTDRAVYPLPDCIFLDLKLPLVHGFEVLEWLRLQPCLKHISVLVLTSSPEDKDRLRAQQLGAAAYLIKPATPEMLVQVLTAAPPGQTVTAAEEIG